MDRANFKGKAKKLWEVAEYVGANPNSTSTVVGNATRADVSLVSDARKLVRRAAGKNANFDKMPSVKSRGVPRMLFKALELIGDDPNASSADVAAASRIEVQDVDALKQIAREAKKKIV
jgi:hypothetical protein